MRIVGGRFRGHALKTPKSDRVRPTSDRLRETLFNVLAHSYGDPVHGARVLDLFAGTGALGFEALSRGAAFALFVEEGVEARGLLRGNVEALGVAGATRIFRRDATKLGVVHPNAPFTLVFADPPYRKGLAEKALSSARQGGWLGPDALAVVEEAGDVEFVPPEGFAPIETRDYGESQLIFLKAVSPDGKATPDRHRVMRIVIPDNRCRGFGDVVTSARRIPVRSRSARRECRFPLPASGR